MRETYSTLLLAAQDLVVDAQTSSTTNLSAPSAFLAKQNNNTIQYLFQKIRNYKTIPTPRTFSTVADQVYYHNPPGLLNIESLTISIGDIDYPLVPIHSQATWDHFQQIDITSSEVPQYFFPRQYDYGIYPTPSDVYTGTVVGNYLPRQLTVADYNTGTIAISQNSATVTGTDTVFTAAMVGRFLSEANSSGLAVGNFYKISAFSTATSITLDTVFEESALSGSTYLIGQSPEIPEELHEYIPYRSAAIYLAAPRRDPKRAQKLLNYFFTGDFDNSRRGGGISGGVLGVINRYKETGRGNSQLNELHKVNTSMWRNEQWGVTLSEAS